jgi:hypothetical protein
MNSQVKGCQKPKDVKSWVKRCQMNSNDVKSISCEDQHAEDVVLLQMFARFCSWSMAYCTFSVRMDLEQKVPFWSILLCYWSKSEPYHASIHRQSWLTSNCQCQGHAYPRTTTHYTAATVELWNGTCVWSYVCTEDCSGTATNKPLHPKHPGQRQKRQTSAATALFKDS